MQMVHHHKSFIFINCTSIFQQRHYTTLHLQIAFQSLATMATTRNTPLLVLFMLNFILVPSFSCPLHHKQALLNFKSNLTNFLHFNYDMNLHPLPSWSHNSDCCSWDHVSCSKTRTVTELHLSNITHTFDNPTAVFFDVLTPLFHIRSLKLLDISGNLFVGEILGDGFGNLTQLVHLDMSENEFKGSIPYQLFGLTNLLYLDMSLNRFEGNFPPEFWNLTSLRVLRLRDNGFNGILSPEVGKHQNLETLQLDGNYLTGNIPEETGNLTKLRELSLHNNQFSGRIPSSIANMKDLEILDLSRNSFSMKIPSGIGSLPNMTTLVLHNNQLTGLIPSSIQNLSNLQTLLLQENKLTGEIPTWVFNITTLKSLFLGGGKGNKLIWNDKAKIVPRCNLTHISMPSCGISGQIPKWISTQKVLYYLDLSMNQLEGRFPYWLTEMDVGSIFLSNNNLTGSIPHRLFESTSLYILNLSKNNFSGKLPDNIGNATFMSVLMLSRNNFSGQIPISMSNMHELIILDLSGNKFSGHNLPVSSNNPRLYYLDLSYNEFSGNIPTTFPINTVVLCLGGNKFSGKLPRNLTKLVNLRHLDLQDNDITGYFRDALPESPNLEVLVLRNNSFEGSIPTTISNFTNLRILDLSENKLTGSIPQEISNLTRMIEIPQPTFSHMSLKFKIEIYGCIMDIYVEELIVNWKNYFHGLSSQNFDMYSLLDLSNNRISGEIPASLGNLKGLKLLNISNNILSGDIPVSFGNLKVIESLDLSHNKISGTIPQSLAKLGELTILDVSNNKLFGKIPLGGQMDTMNELKYFANNSGLCGMQIMIKCPEDIPPSEGREEAEDDEKLSRIFREGTWIGFPIGFFSSILIMGYLLNFLLLFKIW